MAGFRQIIEALFGIPATLRINFGHLPFHQALRLPIICSSKVSLRGNGRIVVADGCGFSAIRLGFGENGAVQRSELLLEVQNSGEVRFEGPLSIGYGGRIIAAGNLSFGAGCTVQPGATLICWSSIRIGADCLISWGCQIIDTDFHSIYNAGGGELLNPDAPIFIGDRTWIASHAMVLKGSELPAETIVGAGSVVAGQFKENGCVLVGVPARVIRKGIKWCPQAPGNIVRMGPKKN